MQSTYLILAAIVTACAFLSSVGISTSQDHSAFSSGFQVTLLPRCWPFPPPTDPYGFLTKVVEIRESGKLTLNGQPIPMSALSRRLHAAFQDNLSKWLFISFEGGSYQDLVSVLDTVQPLSAHIVLLTRNSRREFEFGMQGTGCWFQFR